MSSLRERAALRNQAPSTEQQLILLASITVDYSYALMLMLLCTPPGFIRFGVVVLLDIMLSAYFYDNLNGVTRPIAVEPASRFRLMFDPIFGCHSPLPAPPPAGSGCAKTTRVLRVLCSAMTNQSRLDARAHLAQTAHAMCVLSGRIPTHTESPSIDCATWPTWKIRGKLERMFFLLNARASHTNTHALHAICQSERRATVRGVIC